MDVPCNGTRVLAVLVASQEADNCVRLKALTPIITQIKLSHLAGQRTCKSLVEQMGVPGLLTVTSGCGDNAALAEISDTLGRVDHLRKTVGEEIRESLREWNNVKQFCTTLKNKSKTFLCSSYIVTNYTCIQLVGNNINRLPELPNIIYKNITPPTLARWMTFVRQSAVYQEL